MKARWMVAGLSVSLAAGALFAQSHPDGGNTRRHGGPTRDGGAPAQHPGHAGDAGAGGATHATHDAGTRATSAARDCSTMHCAAGTHCEMLQANCITPCPPEPRCMPGPGVR